MASRRTAQRGTIEARGNTYRAYYQHRGRRYRCPHHFSTEKLARLWLDSEYRLIELGTWTPPAERDKQAEADATTLAEWAYAWMDSRVSPRGLPLSPKTVYEYTHYLEGRLAPLAAMPLVDITRADVDRWWENNSDAPGIRRSCYLFLKSVMRSAVDVERIPANPCRVAYASRRQRARSNNEQDTIILAMTPARLGELADNMDPRWSALVTVLGTTGLRVGEALALRRCDVTRADVDGLPRWTLSVTRTVSRSGSGLTVGPTKTLDSRRTVPVPPHVADVLGNHMARFTGSDPSSPLFPSTPRGSHHSSEQAMLGCRAKTRTGADAARRSRTRRPATGFYAAAETIGMPELVVHDLRRVARLSWKRAGASDTDCELLLGHGLDPVVRAYKTYDIDSLWPVMDRLSQAAGWTPPGHDEAGAARRTPGATGTLDGGVLAVLSDEQIAAMMAGLDDGALSTWYTALPAHRLPGVVAGLDAATTTRLITLDAQRKDPTP